MSSDESSTRGGIEKLLGEDYIRQSHFGRARSEDDHHARLEAKLAALEKAVTDACRGNGGGDSSDERKGKRFDRTVALLVAIFLAFSALVGAATLLRNYFNDRLELERRLTRMEVKQESAPLESRVVNPVPSAPSPVVAPVPPAPQPHLAVPKNPQLPPVTAPPAATLPSAPAVPTLAPEAPVSPDVVHRLERRQTRNERNDRVRDERLTQNEGRVDDLIERVVTIERILGRTVTIEVGTKTLQTFTVTTLGLTSSDKELLTKLLLDACSATNLRETPTGVKFEAEACSAEALVGLPSDIKVITPNASKPPAKRESEIVPGKIPGQNE